MSDRPAGDPDGLPVAHALPALLDALTPERSAAVIIAEPGAGKTTLVPPALLGATWCGGRVVLVEPRRLAARSAATRIAAQLGAPVGRTVGWRMRGDTRVSRATRLEVVTDGVLTRMLQSDPGLDGIDAVVFDEFHERSLDTDVGLALCLDVREALRPDLRLVAMSATIDAAAVAELLGTDVVLSVPGRNHPVDTVWIDDAPRDFDARAVARVCRRALHDTRRDVLVFLPGAAEIRGVQRALEGIERDGVDVLPLHGSLPPDAQDRALAPARTGRRKVVLSTAIAETSLTIEGIDAVVDSGWSRRARFDLRRAMSGLVTTRVSQASADQRQGRAGRTTAGRCYRMWSAADHERLPAHDPPEIVTDDLAPLALDLVRWGDPDASTLRFLDPPPAARLDAARTLLRQLGMLDQRGRLTEHGRLAAALPLHPRLAHAVLRAAELGQGAGACIVAAAMVELTRGAGETADLLARLQRPRDRVLRQAQRLAREVGAPEPPSDDRAALSEAAGAAGLTIAFAYPDRIARRRGAAARYVLSGGAGAELDPHDPLARSEWLAIAELDLRDGRGDARVLTAVALDDSELAVVTRDLTTTADVVEWDRQLGDVRAERQTRLGAIVLTARPIDPGPGTAAALLDGVRAEGLVLLPGWLSTSVYRERVAFCRATFGDEWPDLSEEALLGKIDDWLAPWLAVASRRSDLARVDVAAALAGIVGPQLHARLDELAPREIELPSGRRRRISYDGGLPVLRLRVQDAFGWSESPRIAGGRTPVVLHLLSPADRPVQVTADLSGFWRGSYTQVRAEMRGRYPKHAWPEDPASATSPPRA